MLRATFHQDWLSCNLLTPFCLVFCLFWVSPQPFYSVVFSFNKLWLFQVHAKQNNRMSWQQDGGAKQHLDHAVTSSLGAAKKSKQLPCRSAEVKFFSVFLCQRCREIWREIWREILVKFSVLRFPGFGCATENFTKISRQKRCEKRKISRKFHSVGAQCSQKVSARKRLC